MRLLAARGAGFELLAQPARAEVRKPDQAHLRDRHRVVFAHGVDDLPGFIVRLGVDLDEVVALLLVEGKDPFAPGRHLLFVEEAGPLKRQQRPQIALAEGREAAEHRLEAAALVDLDGDRHELVAPATELEHSLDRVGQRGQKREGPRAGRDARAHADVEVAAPLVTVPQVVEPALEVGTAKERVLVHPEHPEDLAPGNVAVAVQEHLLYDPGPPLVDAVGHPHLVGFTGELLDDRGALVTLLLVEAEKPLDVPPDGLLPERLGGTQAQHARQVALENDDVALDPHVLDQQVRTQGEGHFGAVGAVGQPGIRFGEKAGRAQQTQVALEQVRGQRVTRPDRHEVGVAVRPDPVRWGESYGRHPGSPGGESGRRERKPDGDHHGGETRASDECPHFRAYLKTRSRL